MSDAETCVPDLAGSTSSDGRFTISEGISLMVRAERGGLIDLTGYSLKDLKQMRRDVDLALMDALAVEEEAAFAEEDAREAAIAHEADLEAERKREKKRAVAIAATKEFIAKHGSRYVNPVDPSSTWSGRGHKPSWVKEHLKSGGSLADLWVKGGGGRDASKAR